MRLILRVLASLIAGYRRWLSGRGPLRGVRCSFASDESCSAFGLRVTIAARRGREAIGRIMRRLRRCRDVCLLSDGRALSWSPLHDKPPADIVAEMRADGEGDAAIARMLQTRRTVAIWRRDSEAALACEAATHVGPPRIVFQPAVARRGWRRVAIIAGIAIAALVIAVAKPWLGGCAFVALCTSAVLSARTTISRGRRFELHQTWARRRAHS